MSQREDDLKMLNDVMELETTTEEQKDAFHNMRGVLLRGEYQTLTIKQRSWLKSVLGVPEYENLITNGKAPRGREVPTIPALQRQNLPLKPPAKRRDPEG
jgi:hypothetical protein